MNFASMELQQGTDQSMIPDSLMVRRHIADDGLLHDYIIYLKLSVTGHDETASGLLVMSA